MWGLHDERLVWSTELTYPLESKSFLLSTNALRFSENIWGTQVNLSLQVVKEFLKGEYCLYGGSGWWKYEFCYGKKVSSTIAFDPLCMFNIYLTFTHFTCWLYVLCRLTSIMKRQADSALWYVSVSLQRSVCWWCSAPLEQKMHYFQMTERSHVPTWDVLVLPPLHLLTALGPSTLKHCAPNQPTHLIYQVSLMRLPT